MTRKHRADEDSAAPSIARFATRDDARAFLEEHFDLVKRGKAKGLYMQEPRKGLKNYYDPIFVETPYGVVVTTKWGGCLDTDGMFILGDPDCPRRTA
jgi:hypothetical protein